MPKIKRRNAAVELADGRVLEVRILNPDTIRYEQTAHRNGWPGMTVTDGVATLNDATRRQTFEAWAALRRTGQYDGPWERFEATDCLDVTVEEEDVDPTRPEADPGSSPNSHGSDDAPSENSPTPTTS